MELNHDGMRRTAFHLLSHPGITFARLRRIWPELRGVDRALVERLEIDATMRSIWIARAADIAAYRRDESIVLEEASTSGAIPGLSNEIKQKLDTVRPRTLGQAGRIEGITPAAITLLAAHVRKRASSVAAGE